jgi:hypothetical protein
VSAPIAIQLTIGEGATVPATFWGNGPRSGTYWYTIKVLDRNKTVLVCKLREKWIPASE